MHNNYGLPNIQSGIIITVVVCVIYYTSHIDIKSIYLFWTCPNDQNHLPTPIYYNMCKVAMTSEPFSKLHFTCTLPNTTYN